MADISTIRHDSIFAAHKNNQKIMIIGAGATGSRIFTALVELGLTNITVFDFDNIESHNLANQIFGYQHIGKSKVESLRDWYIWKTGQNPPEEMQFINTAIPDTDYPLEGTVFLLTDTMESRRQIFNEALKGNKKVYRVIETRMASSYGDIFVFNPQDLLESEEWEGTLIDDKEAEVSSCGTSISVGTTASIVANLAVWTFINHKVKPEAFEPRIHFFLQPFDFSTRAWDND